MRELLSEKIMFAEKHLFSPTEAIMTKASCPDFDDLVYNDTFGTAPLYPLDKDRRLGHFLTHGTNNQMVDFRSGIYFNIVMNRSLVPSLFYRRGVNEKVAPHHHVDMRELGKLITLSEPHLFGAFCNGKTGDRWRVKSSQVVETRVKLSAKWWGLDEGDFFVNKVDFHNSWREQPTDKINLLFKASNSSCSAMEHPIRGWTVNYNRTVMNEIIRATPRPRYIRDMSRQIWRSLFGYRVLQGSSMVSVTVKCSQVSW